MTHMPENEIVWTTFYTINNLLAAGNNWPDALALYFKYIEQSRLQGNNQTYSLDRFMVNKMWWGYERFNKSKKILKDLWLIDQVQKRKPWGKMWDVFVRVNFMINQDKVRSNSYVYELPDSTAPMETRWAVEPLSVKQSTNTLVYNINTSVSKINTYAFDEFWELYDKKVDKDKALKKWIALTQLERDSAMRHIPLYKKSQPEKRFRKDPCTYINNKSWENEIITRWPDYTDLNEFHKMMMQDRVPELKQALGLDKYMEIKKLRKQSDLYFSF